MKGLMCSIYRLEPGALLLIIFIDDSTASMVFSHFKRERGFRAELPSLS